MKSPATLRTTQEFLAGMERGLLDLRNKLLPEFPDRYKLLARPYVDEMWTRFNVFALRLTPFSTLAVARSSNRTFRCNSVGKPASSSAAGTSKSADSCGIGRLEAGLYCQIRVGLER